MTLLALKDSPHKFGPSGFSEAALAMESRLRGPSSSSDFSSVSSTRDNVLNTGLVEAVADSAIAIDEQTVRLANQILNSLPSNVMEPEFVIEDDGAVALDWTLGRLQAISVSIYGNGRIGYAWLNGTSSGHAVTKITGDRIPETVLQQIREVAGASVALRNA